MCCVVGCTSIAELDVAVDVLVALFKTCSDDLLKIGAGVVVSVDVQANIVACIAATITVSIAPSFTLCVI